MTRKLPEPNRPDKGRLRNPGSQAPPSPGPRRWLLQVLDPSAQLFDVPADGDAPDADAGLPAASVMDSGADAEQNDDGQRNQKK